MKEIFKYEALSPQEYEEFELFCASILEDETVLKAVVYFLKLIEQNEGFEEE